MTRGLFLAILSGMLVLSSTACQKVPGAPGDETGPVIRTETIGVLAEPATKVTLSGSVFSWADGDEVAVWTGTDNTTGSYQDCIVNGGNISVGLADDATRFNYAIYPSTAKDASRFGNGTLGVILPDSYSYEQVCGEDTRMPMVAVNDSGRETLTFYCVSGLLRITVGNIPSDATGLEFRFPGRKVHGSFTVNNPSGSTPTISDESPGKGEDKVTVRFDIGTAKEMTLNIPLPTGTYDEVFITPVGSSEQSGICKHLKAGGYSAIRARGRKLSASLTSFSVSEGQRVLFSPGNLKAVMQDALTEGAAGIKDWQFAEHQYDYIGGAAGNTAISGDGCVNIAGCSVDLFGWSTAVSTFGLSNATAGSAYSGNFRDWGSNTIGSDETSSWRTLTADEWDYLFHTRSASTVNGEENARYASATLNIDGSSVYGILLFPDNYVGGTPEGVTWGSKINTPVVWNSSTKCTSSGWAALEAAGCVFLPVTGYRNGSSVYDTGSSAHGYYWSASSSGDDKAYCIYFYSGFLNASYARPRRDGLAVRLVKEL